MLPATSESGAPVLRFKAAHRRRRADERSALNQGVRVVEDAGDGADWPAAKSWFALRARLVAPGSSSGRGVGRATDSAGKSACRGHAVPG